MARRISTHKIILKDVEKRMALHNVTDNKSAYEGLKAACKELGIPISMESVKTFELEMSELKSALLKASKK